MALTSIQCLFGARRRWSPVLLPAALRLAAPAAPPSSARSPPAMISRSSRPFRAIITYDLVVRPNIKRAEDLRGKTFAVTSIGGTSWMGVLLWLQTLRPDQQRDTTRLPA